MDSFWLSWKVGKFYSQVQKNLESLYTHNQRKCIRQKNNAELNCRNVYFCLMVAMVEWLFFLSRTMMLCTMSVMVVIEFICTCPPIFTYWISFSFGLSHLELLRESFTKPFGTNGHLRFTSYSHVRPLLRSQILGTQQSNLVQAVCSFDVFRYFAYYVTEWLIPGQALRT